MRFMVRQVRSRATGAAHAASSRAYDAAQALRNAQDRSGHAASETPCRWRRSTARHMLLIQNNFGECVGSRGAGIKNGGLNRMRRIERKPGQLPMQLPKP